MRRAVHLVLPLAAIVLAPVSPAGAARTYKAPAGAAIVRGWAALTSRDPVRGARVRIETLAGRRIPALGGREGRWTRTGAWGTFAPRVRHLPRRYVIVVSGGRAGGRKLPLALREVVTRPARRLADVNLATTLVALRVKGHPAEGLASSTSRVQRLLGIPKTHSLDHSVNASSRYFDGDRFLAAAARHGGARAYLRRLAMEMNSAKPPVHAFGSGPDPRVLPRSGMGARATLRDGDLVDDLAGGLLTKLGTGVLSGIGGDLLGAVLTQVGLGQGAQLKGFATALANLQSDVAVIDQDIVNVQDDINALSNQLAGSTYTTNANITRSAVVDAAIKIESDVEYIAQHPDDPSNAALANGDLTQILEHIVPGDRTIDDAIDPDGSAATGLLDLAQSALFAKLGTPIITGDTLYNQSTSVYQYWANYQAIIVALETEYNNSIGESAAYRSQVINETVDDEASWQELIEPAPPVGTAVDSRTSKMWTVPITPARSFAAICGPGWPPPASLLWSASQVQFHAPSSDSPVYPCGNATPATLPILTAGFGNWALPPSADLVTLTSSSPGFTGYADTSPRPVSMNAWLTSTLGTAVMPDLSKFAAVSGSPTNSFTRSEFNGSEWSLWTNSCVYDGKSWNVTAETAFSNGTAVEGLTYCTILDLGSGEYLNECIADLAPDHLGCDAPIETDVYEGPVSKNNCSCTTTAGDGKPTNERFIYFHRNAVLAERPLAPGEAYWVPATG